MHSFIMLCNDRQTFHEFCGFRLGIEGFEVRGFAATIVVLSKIKIGGNGFKLHKIFG
jgi:hypothetical protein